MTSISSRDRKVVERHLADHEDDEHGQEDGYIKGTDYSLPYTSQWSRMHLEEIKKGLLRHMNCGFSSTYGCPPTLLALKQHAQSLCILIQLLDPTTTSGEINSEALSKTGQDAIPMTTAGSNLALDVLTFKYKTNDAFDFLNDLSKPYTNTDPNHNKPLNSLVNEVQGRHDIHGTSYHCPLAESKPRRKGEAQRPYANHHNLIMHTNACLERLDHEFSSTGGLISLLPSDQDYDKANYDNARNTLLGQWILFTQHLVARSHELERSYGNALDALTGEAAIARQHLSILGPDGRSGREISYPQDRWVLVNAGDDIFESLHDLMDQREALIQEKEKIWKSNGVSGEKTWVEERGGREYVRNIVPVDVTTRFYRLAGQGRNTIFVLPAWDMHPAIEQTRKIERQPTIVSCVQPKFPQRVTELEKRYNHRINNAAKIEMDQFDLVAKLEVMEAQLETLNAEVERQHAIHDALEMAVGKDNTSLALDVQQLRLTVQDFKKQLERAIAARDTQVRNMKRVAEQMELLKGHNADLQEKLAAHSASVNPKSGRDAPMTG